MFFYSLVILVLVSSTLISSSASSSDNERKDNFWDDSKVNSTMKLIEELSYDFKPTIYSEFVSISIESMLFYNPETTLEILLQKPFLFNVFFWIMLSRSLGEMKFPPDNFSISSPNGELLHQICKALDSVKVANAAGLIPSGGMSRKITRKLGQGIKVSE